MNIYEAPPKKYVWLDCDPGIDDMIAIMLAAQNPCLSLLGISTISGNATISNINKNALDIINISGHQTIPVFQGSSEPMCRKFVKSNAHGSTGLGPIFVLPEHLLKIKNENLFSYLSKQILSLPTKITLISTGPLTNYALLLKTFPEVKKNIDSIVFMGGF